MQSICDSKANIACGWPGPRMKPQGTLFVYTWYSTTCV